MKYISVSKILDKIWFFDKDKINEIDLQRAIIKGDCIHNQLESYILNDIKPHCECINTLGSNHLQISPTILEYINSLKSTHTLYTEYPIRDEKLMVRGRIDFLAEAPFENIIIDWKTNSSANDKKKWRLQVALYKRLKYGSWETKTLTKIMIIHINNEVAKNGKPKINKNGFKFYDFEPLSSIEIVAVENIIKQLVNELNGNKPEKMKGDVNAR